MKKYLATLLIALSLFLLPTNYVFANEGLDQPVDPIKPDEYIVRQLSGTGSHTFIFNDGFEIATINSSGSGNIDQNGQIESYNLSTYAYISDGEGHLSASAQLTSLSYSNSGTRITVYYTVKVTVSSGASQSYSGSFFVQ